MARNNSTPVDFWISMPLLELVGWIKADNRLHKEKKGR